MKFGRVEVSGGAVLLWAVLFYLDRSGIIPQIIAACILHEWGHLLALHALDGRVYKLTIGLAGAEIRHRPLAPVKTLLAAMAGPGANLAAVWAAAKLARYGAGSWLYAFAGLNLGLALFNLLPVARLDGGVVAESLFTLFGRERMGKGIVAFSSYVTAFLLLAAGVFLLCQSGGYSAALFIAGLWAAHGAGQGRNRDRLG